MLRGGNPGVNYFYGVRPGTVGGAGSFAPGPFMAPGGMRAPNFPVNYSDPDAVQLPEADTTHGYILPPAGHPVVFSNTLGYFPFARGMGGSGGRPGIGGMGAGGAGASRQSATPRR
jgi:hypothetical protein